MLYGTKTNWHHFKTLKFHFMYIYRNKNHSKLARKLAEKYMGRAMQKHVFGHMWTAKAQISLPIPMIWSGPLLSTARIIGYYRMYRWRAKAWMRPCACAGWWESTHFAHAQRHCFACYIPHNEANASSICIMSYMIQSTYLICLLVCPFDFTVCVSQSSKYDRYPDR